MSSSADCFFIPQHNVFADMLQYRDYLITAYHSQLDSMHTRLPWCSVEDEDMEPEDIVDYRIHAAVSSISRLAQGVGRPPPAAAGGPARNAGAGMGGAAQARPPSPPGSPATLVLGERVNVVGAFGLDSTLSMRAAAHIWQVRHYCDMFAGT
jgi:hypothetical protein